MSRKLFLKYLVLNLKRFQISDDDVLEKNRLRFSFRTTTVMISVYGVLFLFIFFIKKAVIHIEVTESQSCNRIIVLKDFEKASLALCLFYSFQSLVNKWLLEKQR